MNAATRHFFAKKPVDENHVLESQRRALDKLPRDPRNAGCVQQGAVRCRGIGYDRARPTELERAAVVGRPEKRVEISEEHVKRLVCDGRHDHGGAFGGKWEHDAFWSEVRSGEGFGYRYQCQCRCGRRGRIRIDGIWSQPGVCAGMAGSGSVLRGLARCLRLQTSRC